MIPEPQRAYILELLTALGPTADGLVLAGAQAMRFVLNNARPTRDFDFLLDVVLFRRSEISLASILEELGYSSVATARNFQFQKQIPGTVEVMRVEFMAPEEYARSGEIRVTIQEGVHGRACAGGNIVLAESDQYQIEGCLPNGKPAEAKVRVTRPNALVMLKCLAMDDRYRNLRGQPHFEHDRNEARTHAADIVAVVSAQSDFSGFQRRFTEQFKGASGLRERTYQIIRGYFGDESKLGLILYGEWLTANSDSYATVRDDLAPELRRAQKLIAGLIINEG